MPDAAYIAHALEAAAEAPYDTTIALERRGFRITAQHPAGEGLVTSVIYVPYREVDAGPDSILESQIRAANEAVGRAVEGASR